MTTRRAPTPVRDGCGRRGGRRLLAVALVVLALTGCGVVSVSEDEPTRDARDATARSVVDGVETWDLRGEPSAAAFGREEGSSTAIYQSDEPRPVRLLLPGDRTVSVPRARTVDFASFGPAERGRWSFGVKSFDADLEATTQQLREQLAALGLDTAVADRFAADAAAASGSDRVTSPFQTARDDGFRVGVRATYQPDDDFGVVDVAGGWG